MHADQSDDYHRFDYSFACKHWEIDSRVRQMLSFWINELSSKPEFIKQLQKNRPYCCQGLMLSQPVLSKLAHYYSFFK